jgi:hypothetical protein
MDTQKMVVREKLDYAGKVLMPGDEFDCEVGHVELLLAFGKVEAPEPKRAYKTRHMTARGA